MPSRLVALALILVLGPTTTGAGPARHWAFEPVRAGAPPADPAGRARHPVDRFIAAGLREHGLAPAPPADRRTLIRRLTFDLIGLPPTPAEIDAFLNDRWPDAYARLVERLLASPHYGERWGRHWMDLVRYADTAGDNADYPVPEARLYRDWIIDAFNADKPYDEFVREQLAGDVLARSGPRDQYAGRVIATTYLGLSRRYLTAPYERWHLTLEDTIDTTGRVFLGLTLRCARCHDHKFDPITKRDYYALYGIFASTQFPYAGSEEFASQKFPRRHFAPLLPPAEAGPRLAAYEKRLKELKETVARADKGEKVEGIPALRAELLALQRFGTPPELPVAYAVSEGKPADAPVQTVGEPDSLGPIVPRGVPEFLAGSRPIAIAPTSSGRLELANWLTDARNPLTARVMVNRIWQHHFGRGLVATPSNFGTRGEPPTHPELLDWLASRFVASGWSVKAMHRLIVTSQAYQMASAGDTAGDPANRWYGHFERRRLDAEAIRDAMLAASGTLDPSRAGPHPFPPITAWGWTQHNPFKDTYPSRHRSVYLMTQRLQRHPYLALFDGPDANTTTESRGSATVPLQALFLMNNPFVVEQARALARRLMAATGEDEPRVALGYELALGRTPSAEETVAARAYLGQARAALADVAPPEREADAWASFAKVLFGANEFVYVD